MLKKKRTQKFQSTYNNLTILKKDLSPSISFAILIFYYKEFSLKGQKDNTTDYPSTTMISLFLCFADYCYHPDLNSTAIVALFLYSHHHFSPRIGDPTKWHSFCSSKPALKCNPEAREGLLL